MNKFDEVQKINQAEVLGLVYKNVLIFQVFFRGDVLMNDLV